MMWISDTIVLQLHNAHDNWEVFVLDIQAYTGELRGMFGYDEHDSLFINYSVTNAMCCHLMLLWNNVRSSATNN